MTDAEVQRHIKALAGYFVERPTRVRTARSEVEQCSFIVRHDITSKIAVILHCFARVSLLLTVGITVLLALYVVIQDYKPLTMLFNFGISCSFTIFICGMSVLLKLMSNVSKRFLSNSEHYMYVQEVDSVSLYVYDVDIWYFRGMYVLFFVLSVLTSVFVEYFVTLGFANYIVEFVCVVSLGVICGFLGTTLAMVAADITGSIAFS